MCTDSLSFLIHEFSSLLIMFALFQLNQCPPHELFVGDCLFLLYLHRFPYSHQICRYSSLNLVLCGLVFVNMLRIVVLDLNVVLVPNLLHIFLNFSDMPGSYVIIAVPLSFSPSVSLLLVFDTCFLVSLFFE